MPVKQGAYLGSVRDIATLRDRCVIGLDGCWHMRTPYGRPLPAGFGYRIWIHGHGLVGMLRGVVYLATGELVPHAYRTCLSRDCARPAHVRAGPRAEQGAMIARDRRQVGSKARKMAARRGEQSPKCEISDEVVRWIRESDQPAAAIAHAVGCSPGYPHRIRAGGVRRPPPRAGSVFDMLISGDATTG